MSAIWVSVCLAAAAVAAGLAAVCALAALRTPGRSAAAAPAMVVMSASTFDMVLPDAHLLSPLAWVALLVGAALLALLDRRSRVAAAHHAAALLLMAVMWAGMLPGTATGAADGANAAAAASAPGLSAAGASLSAAGAAVSAAGHSGHGQAWTGGGVLLGWLVVAASVALAASAVRAAKHRAGWRGTGVADRLEATQQVSMALAMTAMAAGMLLPLPWA
ncbi:hypothetical protein RCH16_002249 [Cryobacterium sp. MP_M5]|uniref:hypothetical protein n=1 Tax=unclassified Cryobacterium TaxID=2649013 RepID=UPI0018C978E4|nr:MULTISPECIES: hypothetical protein [unclassified Cryobacterium]MBG6058600.1 hypothetical protein [Cryobacterium sp. MP_M3]MEC5177238.1 hypothetical protein [Cryobacterium sp. MP_M5]